MARKAYKSALGINVAAKFLEGFMQGTKERQEMERMAAERMLKQQQEAEDRELKQKQFKLDVFKASQGSKTIYYDEKGNKNEVESMGLSPEQQRSLLGARRGKQLPTGTFAPNTDEGSVTNESSKFQGKVTVKSPPKPARTKVPKSEFLADPNKYAGQAIDIVDDTPKATMTPEQAVDKKIFDTAFKIYAETGSVPQHLQAPLSSALQRIKPELLTEEDKGTFYALKQLIPGMDKSFTLTTGGAPAPTAKTLTKEQAAQYLAKAGGDKAKARQMAQADGFSF